MKFVIKVGRKSWYLVRNLECKYVCTLSLYSRPLSWLIEGSRVTRFPRAPPSLVIKIFCLSRAHPCDSFFILNSYVPLYFSQPMRDVHIQGLTGALRDNRSISLRAPLEQQSLIIHLLLAQPISSHENRRFLLFFVFAIKQAGAL